MEGLHKWGGWGDRTPESFVCRTEGFVCGVAGSDRTLQQRLFAMTLKVLIGWGGDRAYSQSRGAVQLKGHCWK